MVGVLGGTLPALMALGLGLLPQDSVGRPRAGLTALRLDPPAIHLSDARGFQSYLVQAVAADGTTQDVTAEVSTTIEDPGIAHQEANVVYPRADGKTTLRVRYGGRQAETTIVVQGAHRHAPVRFGRDVMPVFMRAGCNTGSCHGAARGKDGFRLSLFGYDPAGDYYRLTREVCGRRINLALPNQSLLLEKATGRVPHTGGTRFTDQSELDHAVLRWLEAGAPADPPSAPVPVGMELFPPSAVLAGRGTKQRLLVRARYSDGTERDVTSLAVFLSNNPMSATVSPEGLVTAGDRGEAFVMARFATFTVGIPLVVLPRDLHFEFPNVRENNFIDALVDAKLQKLRLAPSEVCSDETFLRRATIDLVGLLPTAQEYTRFMASQAPDKRARLVDELLARKEFVDLWVLNWAEMLQIRSSQTVSSKAALLYFNWLEERISHDVPMDQMVRELLAAQGGTFENPVTNYYQSETDTLKVAENVAQVFLGMRIQCAQCHNHPFDRWTQDDYYGFAAFFSQIGRKAGSDPRETIVFNSGAGEVKHPVGGRIMRPKFLGGATADVAGRDRREVLAEWLTAPENPSFARNLANRVWAHFFGTGIVHEVDDVRVSNPPSNPELLAELGRRLVAQHYDCKRLVRDICTSRTYQCATEANASNESDTRNFSHQALRRIRAESFLDCITEVTETKDKFPGLPRGARAVQIADANTTTYFLTTFGRATRQTPCSCEVKLEPTLSQSLHLLNGETTAQKIRAGNVVGKRLAQKRSPAQIIDELYIRCLSRKPTAEEQSQLGDAVAREGDKKKALEDVFWALLNSREFMFNH